MTNPERPVVWEPDTEALYRSAHEAGHLPPGGVSDTFVRPCLICGITVHVVDGRERDHLHHVFEADESLAAFAWWQGHDSADAELEQARAENERLRVERDAADAAAGRRMDQSIKWMERAEDFEGRYEVAHDARMVAESALTEAREQLSRLREAVEGIGEQFATNERECGDGAMEAEAEGDTITANQWHEARKTWRSARKRLRAVLADVTPAVQEAGDAPLDEQESGEARWCSNCHEPLDSPPCTQPDGKGGAVSGHWVAGGPSVGFPAPSGSDDTKGGAAGE